MSSSISKYVFGRHLLFYSSVYILTDISLEIANKQREKKYWHHLLASTMGAGIVSNAAGLSVSSSILLGGGLGVITLPIYYYTYSVMKLPSLYQVLGGGKDGSTSTTTSPSNPTNDDKQSITITINSVNNTDSSNSTSGTSLPSSSAVTTTIATTALFTYSPPTTTVTSSSGTPPSSELK